MGRVSANKPATSCVGCFAWGVLPGQSCRACYTFARLHDPGDCAACGRVVPVKTGYCRLPWQQASLDAKDHITLLQPFLERVTHQQLFLTGMHRIRQPGPLVGKQGRRGPRPQPSIDDTRKSAAGWTQQRFPFDVRRDYSRYDRHRHTDPSNPTLIRAQRPPELSPSAAAGPTASPNDVDRALVILLSGHSDDDQIRHSELFPALRRYGVER
jgi:hypothetical protein